MSGERPSPRSACTLTAIDDHRAVMFAGRGKQGRLNDTFILDLHRMVQLSLHKLLLMNCVLSLY